MGVINRGKDALNADFKEKQLYVVFLGGGGLWEI